MCLPKQITGLTWPAGTTTAGGVLATITGTNFFTSQTVVNWGSSNCPLTGAPVLSVCWIGLSAILCVLIFCFRVDFIFLSLQVGVWTLTCTMPAGQGSGILISVTVGGQGSNPWAFSYPAPTLTSVSPAGPFATTVLIMDIHVTI